MGIRNCNLTESSSKQGEESFEPVYNMQWPWAKSTTNLQCLFLLRTGDSYASILRPIKCRFFICFLSLHHPNKRLKYFDFLFASLPFGSQILRVEKILAGEYYHRPVRDNQCARTWKEPDLVVLHSMKCTFYTSVIGAAQWSGGQYCCSLLLPWTDNRATCLSIDSLISLRNILFYS
jgi:hypothetical protein